MAPISLREINRDNWKEAIRLDVAPDQERFVASNLYSIAEAIFNPTFVPLAIYDETETMVGFLMYGINPDSDELWILRLMVDQRYQGRGYGRAAMEEIIRWLRAEPGFREVFTSYKPDNHVAARLYRSLGFEAAYRIEHGEAVVRLRG
jgi:diamine N-acetyltransferase